MPLLTLCEPGFSMSVGVSKPVGASVAACLSTATTLAPHNARTAAQYFPAMTMAASPRHIDRTGSRSLRLRQSASYCPKFPLPFKFALGDEVSAGQPACSNAHALLSLLSRGYLARMGQQHRSDRLCSER